MLPAQELARHHRVGRVDQLAVVEETRREAGIRDGSLVEVCSTSILVKNLIDGESDYLQHDVEKVHERPPSSDKV